MFFQPTSLTQTLGPLLREAREGQELSRDEAAVMSGLPVGEIARMEDGGLINPDNARIHAVTYARSLGLDPLHLKDVLPPMPDLAPKNTQYLTNYTRPLKPPFRLSLELLAPLAPLGRAVVYILLVTIFLSTWGMMRQLSRVRSIPWITSSSRLPSFYDR
jgi:Helix-turn-helix domain